MALVELPLQRRPPVIGDIHGAGQMDEGLAEILHPLLFADLVFDRPELQVHGLECLTKRRIDHQATGGQGGVQQRQFSLHIGFPIAFEPHSLDLQDRDLVDQFTYGDGDGDQGGIRSTHAVDRKTKHHGPVSRSVPASADQALPQAFFERAAEQVAPELVGCLLVRRRADGSHTWGVVVETEAYDQSEPGCHGHRRRSPGNETLFGAPARFYVYVSYGIHHCVNVVTGHTDWASGVLLRAMALPEGGERSAAGPGLLARWFGLDRTHNGLPATVASGLWLAPRPSGLPKPPELVQTTRIGVSRGQEIPWRWYLRASRSVSRRAPGDRPPAPAQAWSLQGAVKP